MTEDHTRFIYLPGAGGAHERNLLAFASGFKVPLHIETVDYPGWKRYVKEDFSGEKLIEELTTEIERRFPEGPISIIGVSIGGHFGYAVALSLRQKGREISLLCAVDSFIPISSQPSSGWRARALSNLYELLRRGRFGELAMFMRLRAWRTLFRFMEARPVILRMISSRQTLSSFLLLDLMAEQELSMRLLLRKVIPWIATLDHSPVLMTSPTAFLRTAVSARDDAIWRNRCPNIAIQEISGKHHNLFEPENMDRLRGAFSLAVSHFAE